MKKFMDKDFLLNTDTAKVLYHSFAENMPVVDYHCHIDPKEIYEDRHYENISQLWLGVRGSYFGDHYKWRFMRSCGVDEYYITGNAGDDERFVKYAGCLQKAIGNPLYHWSHMELKKYFGFDGYLTADNAAEVYAMCNKKLKSGGLSARDIISKSNVKLICTTDDPADDLRWHIKLRDDSSFGVQVLPAMRPDKAKNIEKIDYPVYLKRLSYAAGIEIKSFTDLKKALSSRMDFFDSLGCRVSDHALEYVMYTDTSDEETEKIFAKRLAGDTVSREEKLRFSMAFMLFVAGEYAKRGWVMQLHYGCKRDNNSLTFEKMGADTGYDCINNFAPSSQLADFLNELEQRNSLPKTILYSLNPADSPAIVSILGCFQDSGVAAKVQQGSAWWFNDHIKGMTDQIVTLANGGNLSGFVGMLTDSRSFLSYTRHDYFRRLLCNIIGDWVEKGMYPSDMKTLEKIVKDICYNNAVRYFNFKLDCIY